MDFQATNLPDRQLFRDAYISGRERFQQLHDGDGARADGEYRKGPVVMARMVFEHGGECRQLAVAACLAGPSLFSEYPAARLDRRLVEFSAEIREADNCPPGYLGRIIPRLSADAKIFFQATAIMLLNRLAQDKTSEEMIDDALTIYSAARGIQDMYQLDTRFEIAAMKAASRRRELRHIWAR